MLNDLRSTKKLTVILAIIVLIHRHEALIGEYTNRYTMEMTLVSRVKAAE